MPNTNKPKWLIQVAADLKRHEGFRQFAYPDPLSVIGRTYKGREFRWGFVPGDILLAKVGRSASLGNPWTVGYGFTKSVNPATRISLEAGNHLLDEVILDHMFVVDKIVPNWRDLPLFAQSVVINMAFNMGTRLYQFKNSMNLIASGKYSQAASSLSKSLWARQTGLRAKELIARLEHQAIAREHLAI